MKLRYLVHGTTSFSQIINALNGKTITCYNNSICNKQILNGIYTTPIFDFNLNNILLSLHGKFLIILEPNILNDEEYKCFETECGGGFLNTKKNIFFHNRIDDYIIQCYKNYQKEIKEKEEYLPGEIVLKNNIKLDKYIKYIIVKLSINNNLEVDLDELQDYNWNAIKRYKDKFLFVKETEYLNFEKL